MLKVGASTDTVTVTGQNGALEQSKQIERQARKNLPQQQNAASANVVNLQQRVAGVLPIAVDVPRTGTSYRFVRPLVIDEETRVTFAYKTK